MALVPKAISIGLVLSTLAASCGTGSNASDENALSFRRVAAAAECGVPNSVKDPVQPGKCMILGDLIFGAADFTKAVYLPNTGRGAGVGITLTPKAHTTFVQNLVAELRSSPPGAKIRYVFVFHGTPLPWTSLPDQTALFTVIVPNAATGRTIVSSVQLGPKTPGS